MHGASWSSVELVFAYCANYVMHIKTLSGGALKLFCLVLCGEKGIEALEHQVGHEPTITLFCEVCEEEACEMLPSRGLRPKA